MKHVYSESDTFLSMQRHFFTFFTMKLGHIWNPQFQIPNGFFFLSEGIRNLSNVMSNVSLG